MDTKTISTQIKKKAIELGFEACGFAEAKQLTEQAGFLKSWLEKGLHATMYYMENHFEKRVDPTQLVPGAKSVISVLLNYYPSEFQKNNVPVVAKYAYGNDYHVVIKEKLKQLLHYINSDLTTCSGRFFSDSAPVLDRAWASEAGLGWIGKNTNLIIPQKGSYFFIGELIVDIELEYDSPIEDYCGSCTKCINACPTNALVVPYLLDSNRCISFQTIENKEEINQSLKGKFQDRVFGCDICQDVCPWNQFSSPTTEEKFVPDEDFLNLTSEDWDNMDEPTFNRLFHSSPLTRTGFSGIRRNLDFLI
jgi:epoxyqueuosine reductase